jgi:hypothetical protein
MVNAFADVYLNCSDAKGRSRQLDRSVGRTNMAVGSGRKEEENES